MNLFLSIIIFISSFMGPYYYPIQYVPKVKYGGNPPRKIAPHPRSSVYRRYEYPPKVELTEETKKRSKAMDDHRPMPVDWKKYNTEQDCPVCKNKHAGGNCVAPRNKK